MRKFKTIIVDDEPIAREIIQSHLSKIPNWILVDSCSSADEVYELLIIHHIDVIFLDIQMPNLTGIEFLESLINPPLIIFTSAFSEYAMKGYELNVVDYLLKPIMFKRFFQAIEKVQARLINETTEIKTPYYYFKHKGKLLKIEFKKIIYIKAEQEYSHIYTNDNKYLVSMHLKKLKNILPDKDFFRIHRSYIIAKDKITSISGNLVQMDNGITLPVAKNSKSALMDILNIKKDFRQL